MNRDAFLFSPETLNLVGFRKT